MRTFARILHRINSAGVIIGCIIMAAILVVVVANVITRAFGLVVPGVYSIVTLFSVFMVCPAIFYTQLDKKHILIDFLSSRFSKKVQKFLDYFSDVAIIITLAITLWAAIPYAWTMWFRPELQDPLYIPVAPFRFFWALTVLFCILAVVATWVKLPENAQETKKEL
jgi:TRAP-type C4-dicarboxylate transport system permease small subunit